MPLSAQSAVHPDPLTVDLVASLFVKADPHAISPEAPEIPDEIGRVDYYV